MQNNQFPERPVHNSEGFLDVHSIFPTIQGEGPFSGHSATFIRLAGCNLQCPFCDTEYTKGRKQLHSDFVIYDLNQISKGDLVVITGGEPFRQDITSLCRGLLSAGYKVQIETNGTLPPTPDLDQRVQIVCSPKTGKVAAALKERITAYKYVINAESVNESDGLPTSILGSKVPPARPHMGYNGPIYVTPMDVGSDGGHSGLSYKELNFRNAQRVAEIAMRYGYIFNLQLHKYVNLP
jgi:7-carboxy-7-deazaguanine synthase